MIAKFPHHNDTWDVMAWETTALDLAELAGIQVPRQRMTRINGRAVLILDRFDRTAAGHRLPYVSAMTLLGRSDATSPTTPTSATPSATKAPRPPPT